MNLPNWFRIIWWVALSAGLLYLLSERFTAIQNGTATSVDAFLFLILVILLLLPLFSEFDFFGVKLKAHIQEMKVEVKEEVKELRKEIINLGISNQVNPNFYLHPPPDSKLPELEKQYKEILSELKSRDFGAPETDLQTELLMPTDVNYLFTVRFTIEKELRRIWRDRGFEESSRRPIPINKMLSMLHNEELLDPALPKMIREVYSVCSPAIHGEEVSEKQVAFVKDIAPKLITTLMDIS